MKSYIVVITKYGKFLNVNVLMKILIVCPSKIKYAPYIDFYLKNFDLKKNKIDVVFWNRDLIPEDIPYRDINFIEFKLFQKDQCAKFLKVQNFFKFHFFVEGLLNQRYDRIIVLGSLTGVLFWYTLSTRYKEKYVLDIRDITYEHIFLYRKLVGILIKNSLFSFVSSDKYRVCLPATCKHKIFTTHNILADSLKHRNVNVCKKEPVVRISFWGVVREKKLNEVLIKKISTDRRFELYYYGKEERVMTHLKSYAQKLRASNIFFHGEYNPEERYRFVQDTDLVHNIYAETDNMMSALSNKFYDGMIFYRPLLCMDGSFMGDISQKEKIGFACNPYKDNFLDDIYDYYTHLDREEFVSNCNRYLEECLKDVQIAKNQLNKIEEKM